MASLKTLFSDEEGIMPRKMKDSGIEWIGEIPEGWSVTRNKNSVS